MNMPNNSLWMPRLLGLGAVALALTACDDPTGPDALAGDEPVTIEPVAFTAAASDEPAAKDEGANVLAEVTLAEGASVRFIDESFDGEVHVGILTMGVPGLLASFGEQELTPLELHLALAPEQEAPALLWEHHDAAAQRQGRSSPAPRQLDADGPAGLLGELTNAPRPSRTIYTASMTGCTYAAAPGSDTWADRYCINLSGGYDACGTGVTSGTQIMQTEPAAFNFLGACTINTNLTFRVERLFSGGLWSLVTQVTLLPGKYVEYESDDNTLILNYRAKMTPNSPTNPYQWGAARRT